MSDAEMDELGPVDYLVVEFPAGRANFSGEMAAELSSLVASGTIRILDLMIITKDDDGRSTPSRSTTSRVSMSFGRWRPSWLTCWRRTMWRTSPRRWSPAAWRACSSGRIGGRRRSRRRPAAPAVSWCQRPDPDPGDPGVDGGRRGLDERRRLTCPSDLDESDGAA